MPAQIFDASAGPAGGYGAMPSPMGYNNTNYWNRGGDAFAVTPGFQPALDMAFQYFGGVGQNMGYGMNPFQYGQSMFDQYQKNVGKEYDANMQRFQSQMPQFMSGYNQAYGQGVDATLAANQQALGQTGYAPWNAARQQNLAMLQGEASGQAPQYLQDFWAKKANERLGGSMGAFAAPNSQFAANQYGRLNADQAYQFHQGALQNYQGALNNYNPLAGMANIAPNQGASQFAGMFNNPSTQGSQMAYQGALGNYSHFMDKITDRMIR